MAQLESEIQIWHSFDEAIPVSANSANDRFQIRISNDAKRLPEELEAKVNQNWVEAEKKGAKNNPVLFLTAPVTSDGGIFVTPTQVRGFKYTQAFNRNLNFHNMTEELNDYKLLTVSTHCHILTRDNKLIFGTKKNQYNQVSGFSGFPNASEDSIPFGNTQILNVYSTILNRLRPEIGYIVDAVDSIKALGITYVNTPGLRGTDSDYIVRVDETAANIEKRFEENSQFAKRVHVVDFEPEKLREFFTGIFEKGGEMSKYALGCAYLVIKHSFGQVEAEKHADMIKKLGIEFSPNNQTEYFSIKK